MKKWIPFIILLASLSAPAQTDTFNPLLYRQFLAEIQTLNAPQLLELHPAGRFLQDTPALWSGARYADSITKKYDLTADEVALLSRQGFMASERLSFETYAAAFGDIYHKDLPIFISADAILHAVHLSYDDILKRTENKLLQPRLEILLGKLHQGQPNLEKSCADIPGMWPMLLDVDLYLAVARRLLDDHSEPRYASNQPAFRDLLDLIAGLKPAQYPLFAATPRKIDFSQFAVRGHYADEYHPELGRYFRAMMWLGRTELYLIPPRELAAGPTFTDVQRQMITAALLDELLLTSGARPLYEEIDRILTFFIGECDNVTPENLREIFKRTGYLAPHWLLDSLRVTAFQDSLASRPFATQRINSQMLWSSPMNPDSARPAASFLLLGQRFIADSWITGQVVFDKIRHQGVRIPRMLPSTLDVLYGLGNDAAAQLLQPELEHYHYAPNLAAVRYLIDGYDEEFWNSSLFNSWLAAIRSLNPHSGRGDLPVAMQTAAWWQRLMNTQLGSWAELRHDNLLYAKQSYSSMVVCSFPHVYVEPVPEFYQALGRMAGSAAARFSEWNFDPRIVAYYQRSRVIFDTLEVIAGKSRSGAPLSPAEAAFLQRTLRQEQGCSPRGFDGWYPELYAMVWDDDVGMTDGFLKKDYLVADIHTSPTDESGAMVGWVLHAGTGPVNLGVVVLPVGGVNTAFVMPLLSYYEHLTTNFQRLSDAEWEQLYALAPSLRPDFVSSWLADAKGRRREGGTSLLTTVTANPEADIQPGAPLSGANYPNPFNTATLIRISVPAGRSASTARLEIFDLRGRRVRQLFAGEAGAGHYLARWDGCDAAGIAAPTGLYFYRFTLGSEMVEGRLSLVR